MIERLDVGDVVWCTAPTVECERFNEIRPVSPRRMQAKAVTPIIVLNGFNEHGEVDDDSHNTCVLDSMRHIHRSELSAILAYIHELRAFAQQLFEQRQDVQHEILCAMGRMQMLAATPGEDE